MDEAAESPNCSVCSHSRNASHFIMQCFYTGIPEIQKIYFIYIYIHTYIRPRLTKTILHGRASTELSL